MSVAESLPPITSETTYPQIRPQLLQVAKRIGTGREGEQKFESILRPWAENASLTQLRSFASYGDNNNLWRKLVSVAAKQSENEKENEEILDVWCEKAVYCAFKHLIAEREATNRKEKQEAEFNETFNAMVSRADPDLISFCLRHNHVEKAIEVLKTNPKRANYSDVTHVMDALKKTPASAYELILLFPEREVFYFQHQIVPACLDDENVQKAVLTKARELAQKGERGAVVLRRLEAELKQQSQERFLQMVKEYIFQFSRTYHSYYSLCPSVRDVSGKLGSELDEILGETSAQFVQWQSRCLEMDAINESIEIATLLILRPLDQFVAFENIVKWYLEQKEYRKACEFALTFPQTHYTLAAQLHGITIRHLEAVCSEEDVLSEMKSLIESGREISFFKHISECIESANQLENANIRVERRGDSPYIDVHAALSNQLEELVYLCLSKKLIDSANEILDLKIMFPSNRDQAKARVADWYVRAGQTENAIRMASHITDPKFRGEELRDIVIKSCSTDIEMALQAAEWIPNLKDDSGVPRWSDSKWEAYEYIIDTFIANGNLIRARTVLANLQRWSWSYVKNKRYDAMMKKVDSQEKNCIIS